MQHSYNLYIVDSDVYLNNTHRIHFYCSTAKVVTRKRHIVNVVNTSSNLLNVDFKEFGACKVIFYCCTNIYIFFSESVKIKKTFEGEYWLTGSVRPASDTGKLRERWGNRKWMVNY